MNFHIIVINGTLFNTRGRYVMNAISLHDAYSFCKSLLLGATIDYALKSPDMNLYDFGFTYHLPNSPASQKIALHVMCSFVAKIGTFEEKRYYGDSSNLHFYEHFNCLIGKSVCGISLGEKGDLGINFGQSHIKITPADDGNESWRIFCDCKYSSHLVVSDTLFSLQSSAGDGSVY